MAEGRKTSRGCVIWGAIIAVLLGALTLGGIYLSRRYALRQARDAQMPPQVLVRKPTSGARFDAQTPIEIHAEAWGSTPIVNASLSLDGRLVETLTNANLQAAIFHASFRIEVGAGPHVIVVRAVDQEGRIGQSLPVNILGNSGEEEGPMLMNWPAEEGETLDDIAEDLGFEPGGLDGVNPGIGNGPLAPGTNVQVPVNPDAPLPEVDVIMPDPIQVDTSSATMLEVIPEADFIRMLLGVRERLLPKAPSGTQATYQNCSIILRWDDNSENEGYFNIWMSGLGHSARIIARASASPGTGPVWVQFDAPEIGFYSFWVEAVNIISSQPSEVAWVGVIHTDTCTNVIGTFLQVELTDLYVPGGYDRFYCYVSVNGFPPKRFPVQDGIFIQLSVPPFNFMIGGDLTFRVPIPDPRTVTLAGECLGWLGDDLVNLGPFEVSVPESDWDGRELTIDGGSYQIKFTAMIPYPTEVSSMVQSQYDLTLPPPYDLRLETSRSLSGQTQHTLSWRWDGDPESIYGFSIFIDGVGLGYAQDNTYPILIPDTCSLSISFTVSALGMDAPSVPSEELIHTTQPCDVTAIVEFISLNIYGEVDDESDCFLGFFPARNCYSYGRTCDGYDAVGWISAEGLTYQDVDIGAWTGSIKSVFPVNCHGTAPFYPHSVALMTGGKNAFTVPLDPVNPALEIRALFFDIDDGPNDLFCGFTSAERDLPFQNLSAEEWATYDETLEIDCSQQTQATVVVRIRGVVR
jgi:hypothetical protein